MATPVVLVHGGGFDARCWDPLLAQLESPALAVDLPGRGAHPADLRSVDVATCARSLVGDADDAGFEQVVLVGHSLAGVTLPAAVGLLGPRVRHVVFVACTVPPDGSSVLDTLEPDLRDLARSASRDAEPVPMDAATASIVLGEDLAPHEHAWCRDRIVAEAPGLIDEPVDLTPMAGVASTWIRTLRDSIVPADEQSGFAAQLDDCTVVDLDAGHMCMVSEPVQLARLVDQVARA